MRFKSWSHPFVFFHLDIELAFFALRHLVGNGERKVARRLEIVDYTNEYDPDGQAFTYTPDEDGTILVEINQSNNPTLALAHELVHVAQIVYGKPLCENEAYRLEEQIKQVMITGEFDEQL